MNLEEEFFKITTRMAAVERCQFRLLDGMAMRLERIDNKLNQLTFKGGFKMKKAKKKVSKKVKAKTKKRK